MGAVMKMDGTPLDQRPAPNNIEAEQALIGGVLLKNDHYANVAKEVMAEDFYEELHREIWLLIATLIEANKLASPVTVKPHLEGMMVGDMPVGRYLAMLVADCPVDAASVIGYAKVIKDLAAKRRMIGVLEVNLNRLFENRADDSSISIIDSVIDEAEEVRPSRARQGGFVSFAESSQKAVDNAMKAYERGTVLAGLSTGLKVVDEALGGLQKTDFIVIAGRAAMGKSAIATNIAYAVARDLREKAKTGERAGVVGVISLEMSDDQVAGRILSERSYVSTHRLRRGRVSESEIEHFSNAAEELRTLPIETDATPGLNIAQISSRARQLAKRKGLALLIVDYIQLIEGGGKRQENRVQELNAITVGLKGLAKELEVPVIGLAQVGRQVEARDDKRPRLSDLKDSGSIEQDADIVMFLYRHEYYLRQAEPRKDTPEHMQWEDDMARCRGRAEVIIAKNRHGPTDTVEVGFDANVTRFKDELPDDVPPAREPGEKSERPKKLTLIKEATVALGILKSLLITASIENDGHVDKAAKGAKLVSYTLWREKCAEELLDTDRDEGKAATLMEKIVKDLRAPSSGHPPLIGRGGSKTEPWVWTIESKS